MTIDIKKKFAKIPRVHLIPLLSFSPLPKKFCCVPICRKAHIKKPGSLPPSFFQRTFLHIFIFPVQTYINIQPCVPNAQYYKNTSVSLVSGSSHIYTHTHAKFLHSIFQFLTSPAHSDLVNRQCRVAATGFALPKKKNKNLPKFLDTFVTTIILLLKKPTLLVF